MRDVGSFAEDNRTDRGYMGFALEVIRKLSALRSTEDTTLQDELISKLYACVTSGSVHGFSDIISEFTAARVSPQELTLSYIPRLPAALAATGKPTRSASPT